ncbi:MAG TPA: hypothetical protein VK468_07655 [Pyrinomonadaceae bacterium]|nr:hypothetical protein [Pyrinomonadaceae bacterium]
MEISNQAARNYLDGRVPDTRVLLRIADRTPFSIHWLLTGRGEKVVLRGANADTALSSGQIKSLIRTECVEVVNELLATRDETARVVVLDPEKIRSEKVNAPESILMQEKGRDRGDRRS